MDRMINAGGYGICLFSANTLQEFLRREKIRKKKVLSLLQKNDSLFLLTQKEGVFVPLPQIDYANYAIKLSGQDESFDDKWERKISYEGFNLEIKDGLWITAIDQLEPFEQLEYHAEKAEFYTTPPFGLEHYRSPQERWYKTLNEHTIYTAIKYDVPAGKYLLSIQGYVRRKSLENSTPNCGFLFSLTAVDTFEGFKNPREADDYDFNIASMK